MEQQRMHGSVIWFSEKKGYGFLKGESGEDYYFDLRSIVEKSCMPTSGDKVVFNDRKGIQGKKAVNVIISKATGQQHAQVQ